MKARVLRGASFALSIGLATALVTAAGSSVEAEEPTGSSATGTADVPAVERMLARCISLGADPDGAAEACGRAVSGAQAVARPDLEGIALVLRASAASWQGRFDLGLPDARRAEELLRPQPDSPYYRHSLNTLGLCLRERGDFGESGQALSRAIALSVEARDPASESMGRALLARLLFFVGDYDSARHSGEQALDLARAAGNPVLEHVALWQLGMNELEAGRPHESIPLHEQALEVARRLGMKPGAAMMELNLADAEVQIGAQGEAEKRLASVRRAMRSGTVPATWSDFADETEGGLRLAQARYDEAARLFARAAETTHSQWLAVRARLGQARALRGGGRLGDARGTYEAAIVRIEQSRTSASADDQRTAFMAANSAAFRELVSLLWETGGEGQAEAAFAIAERGRARSLLDTLHAARLKGARGPAPLEAAAIRATLQPLDLLIEFVDAGDELFAFRLSRDGLDWRKLPADPALAERIRFFRTLLQEPESERAAAAGARLHDQLIAPLLPDPRIRIGRLLIVPDGVLGHLPFEALRSGTGAPAERVFLSERYVTAYLPSASLVRPRNPGPASPEALLAVADPPADSPGSGAGFRRSERGPVPGGITEVKSASRSVDSAVVLTGSAVSEAGIKRIGLDRFRLLHFATHAVVDEAAPLRSGLWLGAGQGEDGWLEAGEICRLRLNADLAVLSACDTGYGRVAGGEGVQSLARAFLYAGSRAVLATLWPIEDTRSARFMARFYELLAAGSNGPEALASARREMSRAGLPASVWAAYVWIGDPNVRPLTASWPRRHGLALAAGLLVAALVGAALSGRKPSR